VGKSCLIGKLIDELLEGVEALESQILEMQNKSFWNRIKKLLGKR
jgi:hypothetical protein